MHGIAYLVSYLDRLVSSPLFRLFFVHLLEYLRQQSAVSAVCVVVRAGTVADFAMLDAVVATSVLVFGLVEDVLLAAVARRNADAVGVAKRSVLVELAAYFVEWMYVHQSLVTVQCSSLQQYLVVSPELLHSQQRQQRQQPLPLLLVFQPSAFFAP